jgi:hypothetical protein
MAVLVRAGEGKLRNSFDSSDAWTVTSIERIQRRRQIAAAGAAHS